MQYVADDGDGNVLAGENKSLSDAGDEEDTVLGIPAFRLRIPGWGALTSAWGRKQPRRVDRSSCFY